MIPGMAADYRVRTAASDADLLAANDRAWADADAISWGPSPWVTRFRALATPAALALRFDVYDHAPWHTMTRRDEHIWEEEVVEIFLDPDRTGTSYYELEINPVNVVCDLVVPKPWPELHSDPSWDFEGLDTRVQPYRGDGAGPDGWTATAQLPWKGFRALPASAALPPRAGDRWRFNVYRIKRPHGPAKPHDGVIHAAWSPTGSPSFHVPRAFRDFVFEPA